MAAATKRRVEILIGAALSPSFLKVFKAVDGAAKSSVASLKGVNAALAKMERQGRKTESVMRKLGVSVGGTARRMERLGDTERRNSRSRVQQARAEVRAMDGLRQMQRNLAAATLRAERAQVSFNRARRDGGRIRNSPSSSTGPLGPTGNGASNARPTRPRDPHKKIGTGLAAAGAAATGLGAAIGLPLVSGFKSFAEVEATLQNALNTAGRGSNERAGLVREFAAMSAKDITNQSTKALSKSFSDFVASGTVGFDDAKMAAQVSGRVATASGGDVNDMTQAGLASMNLMGVKAEELADAFGLLHVSGKLGAFELKDMAKSLPSILSGVKELDVTGRSGLAMASSMLQVVRSASGSAEAAAVNAENLIAKMRSGEAEARLSKVFADHGQADRTPLRQVLREAAANGKDPFVAFMDEVSAANALDPNAVGDVFVDMQAFEGVSAMLAGSDRYKEKVTKTKAGRAADTDKDYAANIDTAQGTLDALSNAWERLSLSIAPGLTKMVKAIASVASAVAGWSAQNPRLAAGLGMVAGTLAATLAVVGPLLIGIGSMVWAWGQLATVFGAGGALARGAASVKSMFAAVALAPMAALGPVLAVVAAIVAIGAVLYKFWEPLKAFFTGAFEGMWEAIKPIRDLLSEVGSIFGAIFGWVKDLLKPVELASGEFNALAEAGRAIGKVIGFVVMRPLNALSTAISMIGHIIKWLWNLGVSAFEGLGKLMGSVLGQERVDAIAKGWTAFVEGIGKVFSRVWDNVIKPLVDGLGSAISGLFDKIDTAKKFFAGSESYDAVRQTMVDAGAWEDKLFSDAINMEKAKQMVAEGKLTPAKIRVIQTDMYAAKAGEKLDSDYYDSLNVLMRQAEAVAATKEVASKGNTVIENKPVTNVHITAPDAPAVARAVDATIKERDDRFMRWLSDGAFDAPGGR